MHDAAGLMEKLGLTKRLIVSPMAGGPSSPELVAAACEAGALGSMGAAYSTPQAIVEFAAKVRARTDRPFAINLFAPHPQPEVSDAAIARAIAATASYRGELGLAQPALSPPYEEDFMAQFEAVLRVKPAALSFVFGLPPEPCIAAARQHGISLIGTATHPREARALAEAGVDAIVLQGIEAGGHRGMFNAGDMDPEMKLSALFQACAAEIKLPLIAAGGLMTARDVQAALGGGAQAVQIGTAFLACEEAGTSEPYKARLLQGDTRDTRTTRVFSGRLARGMENRFMTEMEAHPQAILPFPAQNKFTRDLRTASAAQGSSDFLSLWAGTGEGALWQGPAGELIGFLTKE